MSKFYTAPTAIRALMKFGEEFAQKYDLSTLKVLGTVGEPINPEAWLWYHKYVGSENCSIVDTYWQGSHLFNAFYYNLSVEHVDIAYYCLHYFNILIFRLRPEGT